MKGIIFAACAVTAGLALTPFIARGGTGAAQYEFTASEAVSEQTAEKNTKNNKSENIPVIIYPEENDRLYSEDSIAVRYYAAEGSKGYIVLYDDEGVINTTEIESGTVYNASDSSEMHFAGKGGMYLLDEKYIEPEKNYSLQIVMDYNTSETIHFSTFTGAEEVIKNLLEKNTSPEFKLSVEEVAPSEWFTSSAKAAQLMETITVNVWKIDAQGNKYPTTARITVNKNIKNNYIGAFDEVFGLGFPIKSVGGYNYRNTHGGRLSEHALGTAVDINPDENYCLYSDGTKVGRIYSPYENPYSVTPEVVSIFKKYGFGWGGDWGSTPDYMHFSYFES
ncbi:MAG: M15 family metallopeptidase [Clostridiales bacterium]|nr:M15 family metallopeptidase [Clostridiales bacterium]